jgi:hypothetical protein
LSTTVDKTISGGGVMQEMAMMETHTETTEVKPDRLAAAREALARKREAAKQDAETPKPLGRGLRAAITRASKPGTMFAKRTQPSSPSGIRDMIDTVELLDKLTRDPTKIPPRLKDVKAQQPKQAKPVKLKLVAKPPKKQAAPVAQPRHAAAKRLRSKAVLVSDPLRKSLQKALDAEQDAKLALSRQRSGIERLEREIWAIPEKLKLCDEAIAKAEAQHAALVAAAMLDGKPTPVNAALKKARENKLDLEDQQRTGRRALEQLRLDLRDYEAEAKEKKVAIEQAKSQVIDVYAREMLAKLQRALDQIVPLRNCLNDFWVQGDQPSGFEAQALYVAGHKPLSATRTSVREMFNEFAVLHRGQPDVWQVARERLSDPFAVLGDLDALLDRQSKPGPKKKNGEDGP